MSNASTSSPYRILEGAVDTVETITYTVTPGEKLLIRGFGASGNVGDDTNNGELQWYINEVEMGSWVFEFDPGADALLFYPVALAIPLVAGETTSVIISAPGFVSGLPIVTFLVWGESMYDPLTA